MNTTFSSEWSREEKEEYATKRMNEMKLKNEKFKQRHAEVEKDRIEAEQKCSAVTVAAKVPPKTFKEVEEKPTSQPERRKEREWDIGKATDDGEWSPPNVQQGFRRSRPPSRGVAGYFDGRHDRKDSNWRVREDYDRKDSHQSFDFNKRSGSFRGNANARYPTSYQRSRGRSGYKNTEFSNKSSQNWTDESKKNFSSGSSHLPFAGPENAPRKTSTKLDSDKVWHDDGLNEVQNKQSRVEKWVKSLSSVGDWSESEEKPNKSYSSSGRGSGSYDTPQCNWADDENEDSSAKKQQFFKNRGGKWERKYDHSSQKITVNYGEKVHTNNVSASAITNPEGGRAVYNRTLKILQSCQQKLRFSSDENSSNSKESDHRSSRKGRFNKPKFDQRAPNYDIGETTGSKSQTETNKHGYHNKGRDKYLPSENSGTWENLKTDNSKLKSDDQLDNEKSTVGETSGTWSDVEDSNQNISSPRKRDSGCKWGDEQRDMDGTKNHYEKWGEQKRNSSRSGDYRRGNRSSMNNQRNARVKPEVRRNSDYRKLNQCQNTESTGTWSDQEGDMKLECKWSKNPTESGSRLHQTSNYQKENQEVKEKRSQNKESIGTWSDQEDERKVKGGAENENIVIVKSENEKCESSNITVEPVNSNLSILKEEFNNTVDEEVPISVKNESEFVPNEIKADSKIKFTNSSKILLQKKSVKQCIHIPDSVNSEFSTEETPLIEEKPVCVIQDVYCCVKFSGIAGSLESYMNHEQIIDEKPFCAIQEVFSCNELSGDIKSKSGQRSSSPKNNVLQKGVEGPSTHLDAILPECSKELETKISALHVSDDSDGSTEWSTVDEENVSDDEQLNKVNDK